MFQDSKCPPTFLKVEHKRDHQDKRKRIKKKLKAADKKKKKILTGNPTATLSNVILLVPECRLIFPL